MTITEADLVIAFGTNLNVCPANRFKGKAVVTYLELKKMNELS